MFIYYTEQGSISIQFQDSRYQYRYNSNLHSTSAYLTLYQKGIFQAGVRFITTCSQLSRTYHMMGNVFKQLQRDKPWIIPSIAWRNISVKTCHGLVSFQHNHSADAPAVNHCHIYVYFIYTALASAANTLFFLFF